MNMTSKGSPGEEGVHFGNLSILSLLFANEVLEAVWTIADFSLWARGQRGRWSLRWTGGLVLHAGVVLYCCCEVKKESLARRCPFQPDTGGAQNRAVLLLSLISAS